MSRMLIVAVLICVAPLFGAHADYSLICTPVSGAPTGITVASAGSFDEACQSVANKGFVSCIDAQGRSGVCPVTPGKPSLTMDQIADKAAASACGSYDWVKQGKAPVGYIRGIAMSYANAVCRVRAGAVGATARMAGPLGDPSTDALAWYQTNGVTISNPLRDIYTLAMGEGMLESSGNPTEGPDTKADNPPEGAEAGLFQTSYDSFTFDPVLAELWSAYHTSPQACGFAIFMQGSTDRGAAVKGTGAAADFQTFTKQCPAFALDYALVVMRVRRQHFGPINTSAAEFRPECAAMFVEIENTVTCPQ